MDDGLEQFVDDAGEFSSVEVLLGLEVVEESQQKLEVLELVHAVLVFVEELVVAGMLLALFSCSLQSKQFQRDREGGADVQSHLLLVDGQPHPGLSHPDEFVPVDGVGALGEVVALVEVFHCGSRQSNHSLQNLFPLLVILAGQQVNHIEDKCHVGVARAGDLVAFGSPLHVLHKEVQEADDSLVHREARQPPHIFPHSRHALFQLLILPQHGHASPCLF